MIDPSADDTKLPNADVPTPPPPNPIALRPLFTTLLAAPVIDAPILNIHFFAVISHSMSIKLDLIVCPIFLNAPVPFSAMLKKTLFAALSASPNILRALALSAALRSSAAPSSISFASSSRFEIIVFK